MIRFILCILFISLSNFSYSQSLGRLDSLRISLKDSSIESSIKWHYRIADRYYTKHELVDSQRINIQRGMKLSRQISDAHNIAGGYLDLAYMEMKQKKFQIADSLLNLSFTFYKKDKSNKGLGMVYLARASMAQRKGVPHQIIEYTIKAKEKFELHGDRRGVVACLVNIGQQYLKVNQYQEGLKYLYLAYPEMREVLSVSQGSNLLYTLATAHWECYENTNDKSQLDSAILRIEEGLELTEERKLLYWGLRFKLLDASYDLLKKDYPTSIAKCKSVIESGKTISRKAITADAFEKLADCYQGLGQYNLALQYADSVIFYGQQMSSDQTIRDGLERKYQAYKAKENYQLALSHLEKFKLVNDTLTRADGVARLKEVEQKYESSQKEKEILALSQESDRLKQAAQLKKEEVKSKNYLLLAISLLALLAGAFFIVFYQKKILKEKKRVEDVQRQLWRAQINPHFLFNALNSIQRFYVEGNTEKGNDYLVDFGDLLRKILERSSKTMVTVSEEVEFLKLYIDLENRRLDQPFEYKIELSEELKNYEQLIPALLLQPIVENAIRHGIAKSEKDGKMEIQILKKENGIEVKVKDNGIGFNQSSIQSKGFHQSMGIELVKERINKIGDFSIEEIKGKEDQVEGTEVKFFIKTE